MAWVTHKVGAMPENEASGTLPRPPGGTPYRRVGPPSRRRTRRPADVSSCRAITTMHSTRDAGLAGFMIVSTAVIGAGIGLGIGALIDASLPLAVVGVFIGFGLGF